MNIETRLLYAIAFTLLGIVLAVYVLPGNALTDTTPRTLFWGENEEVKP